jgi:sulfur-oxidizing protein SoxA
MKRLPGAMLALVLLGVIAPPVNAGPEQDLEKFRTYFYQRFPNTPEDDFINGVYAIDPASREQWEEIEDFPPYAPELDKGKELFNAPFRNGRSYASCFENGGIGIANRYPFFDTKSGRVITLELAINECRKANGEAPLDYEKGPLAEISAYMHYTSRGKEISIVIPDDPRALKAYENGKAFYFAKRGQLNMSCADCHIANAGNRIRADILSPALGQTGHFPAYRSTWGDLGTLHRRYIGCNEQVRAKPYEAQSEEYRDLEYYQTYLDNGLKINGPSSRK